MDAVLGTALACQRCFVAIFIIVIGTAILASGGILDAWALDIMGEEGSKIWYGRVRMCTAISWGLGALAMGLINDHVEGCVMRAEVDAARAAFVRPTASS